MQHPDEGIIHAWLDGQLADDQATEIATHIESCPECSAMVGEARGLVAAATRILTSLDEVPSGVIPQKPTQLPVSSRRRWYDRTGIRAAAALLIVAGGSFLVVRNGPGDRGETLTAADGIQSLAAQAGATSTTEAAAAPTTEKPAIGAKEAAVGGRAGASAGGRGQVMSSPANPERATPAPPTLQADAAVAAPLAAKVAADTTSRAGMRSVAANAPAPKPPSAIANSAVAERRERVADADRARAPAGVVEGRVVAQGNVGGVAEAQIVLQGTSVGAITDKDGRFSIINVPAGAQHFIVRRIGYVVQTIALVVPDDASVTANVTLTPATNQLSETVVTGVAGGSARGVNPVLRVVSVDSSRATRLTVYETPKGVRVTLAESPAERDKEDSQLAISSEQVTAKRARAPEVAATTTPTINTISWLENGRRYELSGPLSTAELESIKAGLPLKRR